ncbi:MAG TPA: hypothetical protein VEW65_03535 [Chryseolinea sp.]|jgi:hypothetical protein|nr:hypothetical protein [Chryseolinea sp.]
MKIDKSRLLKKAKKLLERTKEKSNPDGWEINFEVVEEYKVQDQIYTLLVYVKPDQGEDLQSSQNLLEVSLMNAADFLVNEKSKPQGTELWLQSTQTFTCHFGERFSLGVAFREFDSRGSNVPRISNENLQSR